MGEVSRWRAAARRGSLCALLALAATGTGGVWNSAAHAAGYVQTGEFGGPGTGNGKYRKPGRAVVQQSTGYVFAVDGQSKRIQIFRPNGTTLAYLTRFGNSPATLNAPAGIALDQADGDVFVSDGGTSRIYKFTSNGAATPAYTLSVTFASPAQGSGAGELGTFDVPLAIDPTTGDLLAADRANARVNRYDSDTGLPKGSFNGSAVPGGAFGTLLDLTVDAGGDAIVVDATGSLAQLQGGAATSRVLRLSGSGSYEGRIGTDDDTGVVAVDPSTGEVIAGTGFDTYTTDEPLRLHVFRADGSSRETVALPSGDAAGAVDGGRITGMALRGQPSPSLAVVTDLDAVSGTRGLIAGKFLRRPAEAAPTANTLGATRAETSIRIAGSVNANGVPTTYFFEYGTTTAYGQSWPASHDADGGEDFEAQVVERTIAGLQPTTTYHYRVVATNALGTTTGKDRTVTTGVDGPRSPSGRVYEMVSPPAKNGFDATVPGAAWAQTGGLSLDGGGVQSAADGESVTYGTTGAFADVQSSVQAANRYLATRGAAGWTTRGVSIPHVNDHPYLQFATFPATFRFTPDLRTALAMVPTSSPTSPTDVLKSGWSVMLRDNDAGTYQRLVSTAAADRVISVVSASEDLQRIVFVSDAPQAPGVPDDGETRVYESYLDGAGQRTTRLVSVLPDGSPSAAASVGSRSSAMPTNERDEGNGEDAVSADGRRIVFYTVPQINLRNTCSQIHDGLWTFDCPMRLYMRQDGTSTRAISEPAAGVPSDPDPGPGEYYWTSSRDGGKVFFTAQRNLTSDANADRDGNLASGSYGDLYRYDADANGGAGGLIDVTPDDSRPQGAQVLGVVAASDDAERVYFVARSNRLDGVAGVAGQANLYRWDANGGSPTTTFVATLRPGASEEELGDLLNWALSPRQRASRNTADGRLVAFTSVNRLTAYDNAGRTEVYLYDADSGELRCPSCGGPEPATANAALPGYGRSQLLDHQSRTLLSDGSRLFFESAERLVPEDVNDKVDVYEYDVAARETQLVSSGRSTSHSFFQDASPDGRDVFLTTRERLSGWDVDALVDVYDARIGGGIPEPVTETPCEGDACQPSPPGAPPAPQTVSDLAATSGNATAPRPALRVAALTRSQLAAFARTGRVTLRATMGAPGTVRAVATARVRGARGRVVRRTVAQRTALAQRPGTVALGLRLSAPARAQLRRTRRLTVALTVRAGRVPRAQVRTLALTLPRSARTTTGGR